jgi:hypothetical protein
MAGMADQLRRLVLDSDRSGSAAQVERAVGSAILVTRATLRPQIAKR